LLRHRYRRILLFFAGVIAQLVFWDVLLPRIGLRRLSRRTRPERLRKAAVSFRALAISMGGVLIKVGQFLSARLDVLPREVTDELSGLQDEVPPEPFETVRRVLEAELGAPLAERFAEFDPTPLAAASIGQVHRARLAPTSLAEGEANPPPVVVKVQRPEIPRIVETDLAALRVVGGWLTHYRPISKRADVPALLDEFSRSLYEEIDYLIEGKNAETFAELFAGHAEIVVPRIFWSHTTRCVLTLEDVWAIKINDYAAIEAAGISRGEVARRLLNTYFKQIFEDRFFHADPHPGNLFVLPDKATREDGSRPWRLVFVDFGMVGHIPRPQFDALREMLIGVGLGDAPRMVRAYQNLGVLLPGADIELLERASSRMFERFWGKSTSEMMQMHREEAEQFVREFGDLLYEMPFQIPENLILLGRCVGILSGMCTGLDPDFNLWNEMTPYARKLVESEAGGGVRMILDELGKLVRVLIALPTKTDALLSRIEQGRLEVRVPEVHQDLARIERSVRGLGGAILAAAFLLGAVQLYLNHDMLPSAILFAGMLLILAWMGWRR
jgi:predicted unusual protein kinase regulating ubiquinone biosynthesis (AarF/ABC1/UbiB family)